MSNIINQYREKERLFRQLQKELQAMEERQELKRELAFKSAVEDILKEYDKSVADLIALFADDAQVSITENKSRRKRTPAQYKNPHTGDIITVKGGRQKDYQEWVSTYGKDTVKSWKITD